ncbi:glycine zipper family protein [Salmonella enterica]|nr:glycine zipper family protein [Salmonella enterica]
MPARAFFFIIVDEPGKDGFLVRKIYASQSNPYLSKMNLSPLRLLSETDPERYGLLPKDYSAPTSIAEHVMGNNKSSYISTSSVFPDGSPRFDGKTIYIDVDKALTSGAELVTIDEILKALDEYKTNNPHLAKRIDKIAAYVRDIDKEILVKGEKIPAKAIFTPESLNLVKNFSKVGRVVQVVGIVLTAYDLEQATEKSVETGSVKPISAEVIRQAGGWGGFVAGAKIGAVAGAAVGIETGPGAFLTGLVGGIIFGVAGYYGADWVADYIDEN